ncbi:hypothetical protein [Xanthobacter tagetidis]|jgi:hypothetical protein|uniref:DUF2569 family protein n=1 Tax=Xanthobacter tagetidis TaxID=60216 RepID=A0A3L7ANL4_9HYPH|nr:hypothetical protein [Xanthobacter tagetidis]MBB6307650.1 hypothetical protein [Xanthobacter tagetidis]RLP81211.1 hypothetical protein D9R14_04285 [Xanthobacter tagetidis]
MTHLPPLAPRAASSEPRARRLGGALAVIFWCACGITAVPLALMFSVIANVGVEGAASLLMDGLRGPGLSAELLRLGLLPQAVLFVWALAMVLLTVARSRHALTAVPWLMVAWVVVSAYAQFSIRSVLQQGAVDTMDFAALFPNLLLQAATAAAVFGYFAEGRRPQEYYVR